MPRYYGSPLHFKALRFAQKMHRDQFAAILANLPLHQVLRHACEMATVNPRKCTPRCFGSAKLTESPCLNASLLRFKPRRYPKGRSRCPRGVFCFATLARQGHAASDLLGGDASADPASSPLRPGDVAEEDSVPVEEPAASPLPGDPQAVDPVHSALPWSEGARPMPSHLASYDGFMGHSSWWSYWDRHGWLQSMLDSAPPASPMPDPPSPAPVEAPDDTTPLQPSATPSHSTSRWFRILLWGGLLRLRHHHPGLPNRLLLLCRRTLRLRHLRLCFPARLQLLCRRTLLLLFRLQVWIAWVPSRWPASIALSAANRALSARAAGVEPS